MWAALLVAANVLVLLGLCAGSSRAGEEGTEVRGRVTDPRGLTVVSAKITLTAAQDGGPAAELGAQTTSDEQGLFAFQRVAAGPYTLVAEASGFLEVRQAIVVKAGKVASVDLQFTRLAKHNGVVIVSATLEPGLDQRNSEIYSETLFERDDQLLESLGAGLNAGQHEGGGKSLEIRRFGFNLDHGGVNGGLKVVVNDLPQNQVSQGHGQGYLGALKSLTPELVEDVSILDGPFSAEYGDFSGLGVVQIRTRESLPDDLTLRLQGGSFDTYRSFLAYSPNLKSVDSFVSYEGTYTNGPFENHLRYKRNNFTGNATWHLGDGQDFGVKGNFGTNFFYSSGQIPLDLVAAGDLDRFGFIDPYDGGRVRLGTVAAYYRKQVGSEDSFKIDGFVGRSLFDLYSDFTFFLNHPADPSDPIPGDGIQQHDSRLQEGLNTQYLHFSRMGGAQALLTVGASVLVNEVNVGLYAQDRRVPLEVETQSNLVIPNYAGYAQQSIDLLQGRVHLTGGLRWDYFQWKDDDRIHPTVSGTLAANRFQPKAGVSYTPTRQVPLTLSLNYGRGINTQDARGIVERPDSPRIATTDFYEAGAAYNTRRFSLSADAFLIDRSNEQVYIPDDGTFELKGPSRSYGYEGKGSVRISRYLALNANLTQVTQSYFRGSSPRVYVDSAPHTVEDAGITLSGWRGIYSSLRWRHVGNYLLDDPSRPPSVAQNPNIRASGLDVVDLALTKKVRKWVSFSFDVDNLTDKRYFETQNFFESRVTPMAEAVSRIHGTPGYPVGFTAGLTFQLGAK